MNPCILSPRRSPAPAAHGAWHIAAALLVASGALVGDAAEAPQSAQGGRQRIVDPAIVPAGGAGCRACGPAGCRHAKGGLHGHHAGCRDGVCVPYCPVRPQQFGYYGTRWRKWPGQDVVQVSGEAAAAPVQPPRSEVPGATEESLAPPAPDASTADADTRGPAFGPEVTPRTPQEPAPMPAPPRQPEPMPPAEPAPDAKPPAPPAPEADQEPQAKSEPMPEPAPDAVKPEPAPDAEPAPNAKPAPDAKPAPTRPEDENLFEVLSGPGWRAKRKFAVGNAATPADEPVRPAAHVGPVDARDVPPVPFDRAAETRRLRSAR